MAYGTFKPLSSDGFSPSSKENTPMIRPNQKVFKCLAVAVMVACLTMIFSNRKKGHFFSEFNEVNQFPRERMFPNIIYLLVDDLGHNDMGYSSQDLKMTPTLDSLAERGIKLTSYYTMYVCTPARASLLTGKYAIHNSMQKQVLHETAPWGLPLENRLLPELLKEMAHYETHIVGKWHLGFYYEDFLPTRRGFDSHFGYYAGEEGYWDHAVFLRTSGTYYDWSYNGTPYPDALGKNSLELMENRVDDILRSHDSSKPLFLMYSQQAIHYPLDEVPERYLELAGNEDVLESVSNDDRRSVAKLATALDQTVKSMLDTMKETGLYENSVIIIASDNGGCSYYGGSNYPLRGEKNSLWEGGIKVPAFIHSPLFPAALQGTKYDGLFHVSDWMPTIIEGFLLLKTSKDLDTLDGKNQWPAISSGADAPRTEILHNIETAGNGDIRAAIQLGNYKLLTGEKQHEVYPPESPNTKSCDAAFEASSKLSWVFNIAEDPTESHDKYHSVDDVILSNLWDRLDYYHDTQLEPAYEQDTFDTDCYDVWAENHNFVIPWHDEIYDRTQSDHNEPDTSMHP